MRKKDPLKSYYQTISAMGKLAMTKKKAEGETMSLAPLGYRNVRINGRSTIEPDPKTFEFVQKAYELRKKGLSIRTISHILEKDGLSSRRGKSITPMTVWRVLNHPLAPKPLLQDFK